jgi:N-acetylglucosaminyldiphosphoundecaprenol N-acetyl-beta-D-mannosaminyltransferase
VAGNKDIGTHTSLAQRIYIHKAPVDVLHPRNLLMALAGLLQSKTGSQIIFVRSWDILKANRDPLLLKTLENAALVLPVSRTIASMAKFMGKKVPHCYYPFDTIIRILTWLESMDGSLFLLGGGKGEIQLIEQNVRQTFPGIRFLGRHAGVFPKHMDASISTAVQKANPNLLLAGKGLEGRDRWLYSRRTSLSKGLFLWSGEWFDFIIQKRRRPVKPAVRAGREWISELYSHPGKILRVPLFLGFWLRLLAVRVFSRSPARTD